MSPRSLLTLSWRWLHHTSAPALPSARWNRSVLLVASGLLGVGLVAAALAAGSELARLPPQFLWPAAIGSSMTIASLGVMIAELRVRRRSVLRSLAVLPLGTRQAARVSRAHVAVLAAAQILLTVPATITVLGQRSSPIDSFALTTAALTVGMLWGTFLSMLAGALSRAARRPGLFGVALVGMWFGWFALSGLHGARPDLAGRQARELLLAWPVLVDLGLSSGSLAVPAGTLASVVAIAGTVLLWRFAPPDAEPAAALVSMSFRTAPLVTSLVVRTLRNPRARHQLAVGAAMVVRLGVWSMARSTPLMSGIHAFVISIVCASCGLSVRTLSGRRPHEVPLLAHPPGYRLAATSATLVLVAPLIVASGAFAAVDEGRSWAATVAAILGISGCILGPALGSALRLEPDNISGELLATGIVMAVTASAVTIAGDQVDGVPHAPTLLVACALAGSVAHLFAHHADQALVPRRKVHP